MVGGGRSCGNTTFSSHLFIPCSPSFDRSKWRQRQASFTNRSPSGLGGARSEIVNGSVTWVMSAVVILSRRRREADGRESP